MSTASGGRPERFFTKRQPPAAPQFLDRQAAQIQAQTPEGIQGNGALVPVREVTAIDSVGTARSMSRPMPLLEDGIERTVEPTKDAQSGHGSRSQSGRGLRAASSPTPTPTPTPKTEPAAAPSKEGESVASVSQKAAETTKPAEVSPQDDAARATAAEAKANQLLAEIHKGAMFEEVAKKSSDGPTAAQGGDLGAFKRGTLAKELEEKVFAMKTGDVSDVIRTKQGYIILKVVEHQGAGVPPQKEVEQQIQETLYYEKLQPALRSYLMKLREDAYIDIKPGFVDTGASPNQTKPIVVASAASSGEQQQKKKKKKKLLVF
jgi:parvulin-like peptidyl-prolyl isomerase